MSLHRNCKEPDQPPALDNHYLDRLSQLIGASALGSMLDDGRLEIADQVECLADLAATGDKDQIAALAHTIAGSAGQLGLTALSTAAADLSHVAEQEQDRASDAALRTAIDRVLAACEPTMAAIALYRAQQTKALKPRCSVPASGGSGRR